DDKTAIWTALAHAYDRAGNIVAAEPDHLVSIVLMTDGRNNSGSTLDEVLDQYAKLPAQVRNVRTFTVRFGDADASELTRPANGTLGMYFDADATSLLATFKDFLGYQ